MKKIFVFGAIKEDDNFITVYANNCVFTIAKATGDWGFRKAGSHGYSKYAYELNKKNPDRFGIVRLEVKCND